MNSRLRTWWLSHRSAAGERRRASPVEIAALVSYLVQYDGGTTRLYFDDANGTRRQLAAVAHLPVGDGLMEWTIELDGSLVDDEETLAGLLDALRPFAVSGLDREAGTPEQKTARMDAYKALDVEKQRQWMLTGAAETVVHHIDKTLGRLRE